MKKMLNTVRVAGLLYEHNLEKKVAGAASKNPGVEYITGTISIATDNDCLNIVPVHYTYATETTSKGKPNPTFAILSDIINDVYPMVMKQGKDSAAKISVLSSIGLNEFYTDRGGKEELVSVKRNEGGLIRIGSSAIVSDNEKQRNEFDCDMLITGMRHIEADPEKKLPEKGILKGALFNDYNKTLMPVEFTVLNPEAISYFEGLEPSPKNPIFTEVKGYEVNTSIEREIVEEGAFGNSVRTVSASNKDWIVSWAAKHPYEWDDEETLTAAEVSDAVKAREIALAAMKQRSDEYKASKNTAAKVNTTSNGGFNF